MTSRIVCCTESDLKLSVKGALGVTGVWFPIKVHFGDTNTCVVIENETEFDAQNWELHIKNHGHLKVEKIHPASVS